VLRLGDHTKSSALPPLSTSFALNWRESDTARRMPYCAKRARASCTVTLFAFAHPPMSGKARGYFSFMAHPCGGSRRGR
jgi:hypothetical protein